MAARAHRCPVDCWPHRGCLPGVETHVRDHRDRPSSSPCVVSRARTENPYLRLGGLNQAVDLVGVALTDQTTQLEMQAISEDVEYFVQSDVRTSSPLLLVDVKDSSPETAIKIRDILVARVPVRLDAMQNALGVGTRTE